MWFRILHVAPGSDDSLTEAELLEQTVEVALGPKGAFENGSVGTLVRRVTGNRVVNAAARPRRAASPPRQPRTSRAVEFLLKAQEWRRQLDSGEIPTRAEIARREGVTRARVTQILAMLRLAPEIQERILDLPEMRCRPAISERALRPIAALPDSETQGDIFAQIFA